jgi:hypothetical protein
MTRVQHFVTGLIFGGVCGYSAAIQLETESWLAFLLVAVGCGFALGLALAILRPKTLERVFSFLAELFLR